MKAFLIFILCLTLTFSPAGSGRAQNFYTIQIASLSKLEAARELAKRISNIVPLVVRLEKTLDNLYAVRAGAVKDQGDLIPYLKSLTNAGYSSSYLRVLPYTKESLILEIPSSMPSPGSSSKEEKPPLLLNLSQKEQRAVELIRKTGEGKEEQVLLSSSFLSSASESPLLGLNQKEQPGTGLIKKTDEKSEGKILSPLPKPADEGAQFLSAAWESYEEKDYRQAVNLFTAASEYPETSLSAKLGLAYSYLKLGKNEESLLLLEELVKKRFRSDETLPNLIDLLIRKGDYDKAAFYIDKLDDKKKKKWREKIEKLRLDEEFNRARKRGETEELIKFTDKNKDSLNRCLAPESFYYSARILAEKGDADRAADIQRGLLAACPNSWVLRLGIFYELKPILPFPEMKTLVEKETRINDLPSAYSLKLSELKLNLLRERLSVINTSSPETKELADEILLIQPEDRTALTAVGWWNYHNKEYKPAYNVFSGLHKRYPDDKDYALGLVYTLIELNKDEEALDIAERSKINGAEMSKIRTQIYFKRANKAYENRNYAEAENYLEKLLDIDSDNYDAKSLLAWTLYNQSNFDEALPLFLDVFEKRKGPEVAEGIIYSYEKSGRSKAALDFSREIAKSKNESLREVSADYFFAKEMPVSAATIHADPETPYYNADKPWLDSSPFFRHKSGTSGFSRLNEVAIPVSMLYTFGSADIMRLSFITQWLSSGDSPPLPFAGSFTPGETQERDLVDSLWVFTPEIGFEREGYTKYSFSLGITPLNGKVYPVPTFYAEARRGLWNFNVHQNSVRESILSYVGQDDPYSGREWGRVLKTGAEAGVTFVPFSYYWITLAGGYDYYWGNNVKGNNEIHGTVSFGKTMEKKIGNVSLGVFVSGQHFQRNSDFFTFGHGGYFSPEILVITGPTVSFETKPRETFWLSGQASVGFLYFHTEDAPFFPLRSGNSDGEFDGDSSSQVGFSGKLEGLKLLTPHFAGGFSSYINRSADFTEWSAGLTVRYYFDSRFRLLPQQRNQAWSLR